MIFFESPSFSQLSHVNLVSLIDELCPSDPYGTRNSPMDKDEPELLFLINVLTVGSEFCHRRAPPFQVCPIAFRARPRKDLGA